MGQFDRVYRHARLEKIVEESTKEIYSEIKKIDKKVKSIQEEFKVAISLGSNRNSQNRTYISSVLKIAAAPLCFVPVAGPVLGSSMAALAGFIEKGFFNIDGLDGFVLALSARGLNHPSGLNDNPIQVFIGGGEDNKGKALDVARMASASRFVWLYGDAAVGALKLIDGIKIGDFKLAIENINKFDLESEVDNYQVIVKKSVKQTVQKMDQQGNQHLYMPLLFSKMCQDLGVAGQGSQMMQSLDFKKGKNHQKWIEVDKAKDLLSGKSVEGKVLDKLKKARGSKVVSLAKQRFDGIGNYISIFNAFDNQAPAQDQNLDNCKSMITPIYLEKLRLCAYRSRYSEALKPITDTNFLTMVNHYEQGLSLNEKFFNRSFYGGRNNGAIYLNDCVSAGGFSKLNKKAIHNHSQYRRRIIYSWYCFHQILKAHLGTYILSSLPTLGINPQLDRRVMFALIDAVTTAWWVITRAYEVNNSISKSAKEDLKEFEITVEQLLQLPYIADYFDPKNIILNKSKFNKFDSDNIIRDKLLRSYNNLFADNTGLVNIVIESLMPRKTSSILYFDYNSDGGFNKRYVRDFITEIYADFRAKLELSEYSNFYYVNVRNYRSMKNYRTQYIKDFTERFNRSVGAGSAQSIKNKYLSLIYQNNVPNNLQPSIYTEFSNNLANVHMGAIVNAQEVDQFSQLEFNRSVARSLKSLAKIIARVRASNPKIFDAPNSISIPEAPLAPAMYPSVAAPEAPRAYGAVGGIYGLANDDGELILGDIEID